MSELIHPPAGRWLGWRTQLMLALGIAAGLAALAAFRLLQPLPEPPRYEPARLRAWEKVTPHLEETDEACARAVGTYTQRLQDFFAERRQGARPFAQAALSLGGKWALVRSHLPLVGDETAHRRYLREQFECYVFTPQDLQAVVEGAVAGFLSELDGQENQLLVRVQQDLSDDALAGAGLPPSLRSEEMFLRQYRDLVEALTPVMARDLQVAVGREVMSFIAAEVAANIAVRLAVSAGVLGTGAASGVATLGIGVVAGVVIDQVIDWILRQAGYNPEGEVAARVEQALDRLQALLIDGDREAVRVYAQLRQLQEQDLFEQVRTECRLAADRIDRGGHLGLRHELRKLHELRARVRNESLKKLILVGGSP